MRFANYRHFQSKLEDANRRERSRIRANDDIQKGFTSSRKKGQEERLFLIYQPVDTFSDRHSRGLRRQRAKACGGFSSSRPSSWLPHHTRTHSSLIAESRFHASHDARESWTGPGSSWSFLFFIPLLGLVNCILLGLASLGGHLQRYSLQRSIGAWRGGPAWLRHIRHKSHYLDPDCLIGKKLHQGS